MKFISIFTMALLFCFGGAAAAGLGEPVQIIGPWHVLKDKDPMTDAVNCTAIYQGNFQVQISLQYLAIGLRGRGGISGYTLRLDDRPAGDMKLASNIEKRVGAALIEGDDFAALLQAKRVRFQALTALSTLVNEDLDFRQIESVIAFLGGPICTA